MVMCQCDCGVTKPARVDYLESGRTKSCGCYNLRIKVKHGGKGQRLYNIWMGLKSRCNNKNNSSYKNYGGRGISVQWSSYQDFFKDMARQYNKHVILHGEENTSIDRIDVNGNYSKENCHWATRLEQSNNKRTIRPITINGETKLITEWFDTPGAVNPSTFYRRLERGFSEQDALMMTRDEAWKYSRSQLLTNIASVGEEVKTIKEE
jgi:hypothetical protein